MGKVLKNGSKHVMALATSNQGAYDVHLQDNRCTDFDSQDRHLDIRRTTLQQIDEQHRVSKSWPLIQLELSQSVGANELVQPQLLRDDSRSERSLAGSMR